MYHHWFAHMAFGEHLLASGEHKWSLLRIVACKPFYEKHSDSSLRSDEESSANKHVYSRDYQLVVPRSLSSFILRAGLQSSSCSSAHQDRFSASLSSTSAFSDATLFSGAHFPNVLPLWWNLNLWATAFWGFLIQSGNKTFIRNTIVTNPQCLCVVLLKQCLSGSRHYISNGACDLSIIFFLIFFFNWINK